MLCNTALVTSACSSQPEFETMFYASLSCQIFFIPEYKDILNFQYTPAEV